MTFEADFTVPKSGIYTINYAPFYPGNYDGKSTIAATPEFDDRMSPGHGNQIPIQEVEEGFDHFTIKTKPGSHWWYRLIVAVPDVQEKVLN